MLIIGIVGLSRHGKDTIGKIIEEYYKGSVYSIAFAKVVKEDVVKLLGMSNIEELDYHKNNDVKWKTSSGEVDVLEFLLGYSRYVREANYTTFLDRTKAIVEGLSDSITNIVFTDVREKIEDEYITSKNGILINVFNPNIQNKVILKENNLDTRVCEIKTDITIVNTYNPDSSEEEKARSYDMLKSDVHNYLDSLHQT